MRRVAVVTDSNSGITQSQAEKLRVSVLPMPVIIDNQSYFEDINLTQQMFYKKLMSDCNVSTSQCAPGAVLDMWDELLEEYEEIVTIPMSSGLSSSYHTASTLAEEYDGKVQVVDNQRISVTQRRSVNDAVALADAGWDAASIKERLESMAHESSIYIMVDTLKYLKKGGRVTQAAAAIGSVLNIKPVLQIQGQKLDYFGSAMGVKQARAMMIEAIRNDFSGRFAGHSGPGKMWLDVAYTHDEAAALDFVREVEEAIPGYEIHMDPLSLSVSCHIGPGALALACASKLENATK